MSITSLYGENEANVENILQLIQAHHTSPAEVEIEYENMEIETDALLDMNGLFQADDPF